MDSKRKRHSIFPILLLWSRWRRSSWKRFDRYPPFWKFNVEKWKGRGDGSTKPRRARIELNSFQSKLFPLAGVVDLEPCRRRLLYFTTFFPLSPRRPLFRRELLLRVSLPHEQLPGTVISKNKRVQESKLINRVIRDLWNY